MANEHILVVDDNVASTQMMGILLRREGYEVTTKNDPFEALKWLHNPTNRPDLLISDLNMPKMSGHELVKHIKQDPTLVYMPIIMLTAQHDMAQKIAGFEAGVDDYLTKPVSSTELILRIKALLTRSKAASGGATTMEGKAITVSSLRGGVGTSTIAVNLAIALARMWQSQVPLIDLALTNGHCALMLDIKPKNTIVQLAEKQTDEIDIDLLDELLLKHDSGVMFLPAPISPVEAELVNAETINQIIPYLRVEYPFTVIDAGSTLQETTLTAFDHSSAIILVLSGDLASLKATSDMFNLLKQLEYDSSKIFPVLNHTFRTGALPPKDIETALNRELALVIPFAGDAVVNAINRGEPIISNQFNLTTSKAIARLAFNLSPDDLKTHPPEKPSPILAQFL